VIPLTSHNQDFISGSPEDLATDLGSDGVLNFLSMFCEAYSQLKNNKRITPNNSEPDINEEFFIELSEVLRRSGCSFYIVPEKQEKNDRKRRGKFPTIDFCFRARYDTESIFGAECKLLKDTNESCNQYVSNGVRRFILGKYSKKSSFGSMIGYILVGSTPKIISRVEEKINKVADISKMQCSNGVLKTSYHYESIHSREKGLVSPFQIHHLFFSFNEC